MRRTQILVVELRPEARPVEVGQLLVEDPMSLDVQGWVIQANAPMEEDR
jgi:hypothetical protein